MDASGRKWIYRLALGLALALILFTGLVPATARLESIANADIAFCLVGAWLVRRPEYAPLWLLVAFCLATEIVYMLPVGLWSAFAFAAAYFLRGNVERVRMLPFTFEWLLFSSAFLAASVLHQISLVIFFVDAPPFSAVLLNAGVTALFYPPVVLATNVAFRLRKQTPFEAATIGARI